MISHFFFFPHRFPSPQNLIAQQQLTGQSGTQSEKTFFNTIIIENTHFNGIHGLKIPQIQPDQLFLLNLFIDHHYYTILNIITAIFRQDFRNHQNRVRKRLQTQFLFPQNLIFFTHQLIMQINFKGSSSGDQHLILQRVSNSSKAISNRIF